MQGSLLKMMRAEPKQEVVKVDSFSIFWLRSVFNFYLSFQMTGLDSHQTLQLAHRCAFFYVQTNPTLSTSVSVKPVQFPSFIYTQNFHVRQLSIQRKPDRHRDGERYRDKGLKRKLRVAGFIIEKKKLKEAAGKQQGEEGGEDERAYILWCYGEHFGRNDTPSHKVGS